MQVRDVVGNISMIATLIRSIRDLCNHPWKRELLYHDKVKWNKLWTSLDAIDDAQQAIDFYKKLPEFNSYNGGFLFVYGLMQALNVQQDASNNLLMALFDKETDFETEYPELFKIREYRNNSTGHPTKRGNDKSFHFIGKPTLKKSGFTLASYFPKAEEKSTFEDIDVMKCIETQNVLISKILKETMDKLKSDFKKHKSKFKGKHLADLIHDDFHYEFSKLYGNIGRDYPPVKMNYEIIKEAYEELKNGIIERYFSLKALSGVYDTTQRLDYIFHRVKRDLIDYKIHDDFELYIFVDVLKSTFKEFQEMISEIDKDFE